MLWTCHVYRLSYLFFIKKSKQLIVLPRGTYLVIEADQLFLISPWSSLFFRNIQRLIDKCLLQWMWNRVLCRNIVPMMVMRAIVGLQTHISSSAKCTLCLGVEGTIDWVKFYFQLSIENTHTSTWILLKWMIIFFNKELNSVTLRVETNRITMNTKKPI